MTPNDPENGLHWTAEENWTKHSFSFLKFVIFCDLERKNEFHRNHARYMICSIYKWISSLARLVRLHRIKIFSVFPKITNFIFPFGNLWGVLHKQSICPPWFWIIEFYIGTGIELRNKTWTMKTTEVWLSGWVWKKFLFGFLIYIVPKISGRDRFRVEKSVSFKIETNFRKSPLKHSY